MSEDLFHDRIAPELRWVRIGRVKIVAVSELRRWLDANGERAVEDTTLSFEDVFGEPQ